MAAERRGDELEEDKDGQGGVEDRVDDRRDKDVVLHRRLQPRGRVRNRRGRHLVKNVKGWRNGKAEEGGGRETKGCREGRKRRPKEKAEKRRTKSRT